MRHLPPEIEPAADAAWSELGWLQARGMACVICGRSYITAPEAARQPAGRSRLRMTVYACTEPCRPRAPHRGQWR